MSNLISDQGDNPFSVVFDNGLSPLGYKNGRLYADEFEKLYSSDSGLEFGGSIIDNNPPEGWRFVIYYRNGLVMCGQKDDGTMIGFGEGGAVAVLLNQVIQLLTMIQFECIQVQRQCVT